MIKTVSSVMDLSDPWDNPHGGQVWFVTAFTTDGEVLSAGRKDEDAAAELQGLLIEAIGVEQDFELAPDKPTKSGKTKWKILGFGTPGGAATYTAPGVQGGVSGSQPGGTVRHGTRPPEHDVDASIRAAVALKAAVRLLRPMQEKHETGEVSPQLVMAVADWMNEWLARTSEPASSAYKGGDPASTVAVQAGAGSEDLSGELSSLSTPDGAGLVDSGDGEAPESTPHLSKTGGDVLDPNPPAASERGPLDHIHDYQLRQGVKGFLVCECGKTRKKETANTAPE